MKREERSSSEPSTERVLSDKHKARRRLLKNLAVGGSALAAGGQLPQRWSRPVVDAVLLPAHAETSPPQNFFGTVSDIPINPPGPGPAASRPWYQRALDAVVPEARAGNTDDGDLGPSDFAGPAQAYVCVFGAPGGDTATLEVVLENFVAPGTVRYRRQLTVGSGDQLLVIADVACPDVLVPPARGRVDEIALNATGNVSVGDLNIAFDFAVPPSPCSLPRNCPLIMTDEAADLGTTDAGGT